MVKLHLDPTVVPKKQPYRRLPYHLVEAVDRELDKMIEHDIIEAVTEPPEWISALVGIACFLWIKDGIRPMESKVKALKEAKTPENAGELHSFLGLAVFLNTNIPHCSNAGCTIMDLTRDDVLFEWKNEHEVEFNSIEGNNYGLTSLLQY